MRCGAARFVKRVIDLLGAVAGLLLFSPLMVYAACKVRRANGSPVFYCQMRAGLDGKPFKLYKFRTMNDERDSEGNLLPDAQRITSVGAAIRGSSLDELPQLLNVLKGEMSLVGPRPLLLDYVPLYSPEQKKRLTVPQGITGWAQINGRNAVSWSERFAHDVWYVENRSLLLDLKILLATVTKVLRREGISAEGEITMPRFEGDRRQ